MRRHARKGVEPNKARLRTRMLAVRRRIDPGSAARASEAVADAFTKAVLPGLGLSSAPVVGGYWPVRGELDPRPLLEAAMARGCKAALPVIDGEESPLGFAVWFPGDPLKRGLYDIPVPIEGAERCTPAILFVPLLAFDRQGRRLGYGGGYYDRTIQALRRGVGGLTAIGVGYAVQEIDVVPNGDLDQRLDWILTERGAIAVDRDGKAQRC